MSAGSSRGALLERFAALEAALGGRSAREERAALGREYAALAPVVGAVRALEALETELASVEALAARGEDGDMRALAREEAKALRDRVAAARARVGKMLAPEVGEGPGRVIVELRAGTGGEEAALFTARLFRMYERYAAARGWTIEAMGGSAAAGGGWKEIVAALAGRGVWERLRFESGVHRVQRVPVTESTGRIHTSTATVAVLPEPDEVDVVIEPGDVRVDVFRASGPGGQSVNTTDSAVRITHLPTGLSVIQQDEKSQHKNRARALRVLRARLRAREQAQADAVRARARREQIGSGDRSGRVRTYNFLQGRVTDHRIGLTLHQLEAVLEGDLDRIIDALARAQGGRDDASGCLDGGAVGGEGA